MRRSALAIPLAVVLGAALLGFFMAVREHRSGHDRPAQPPAAGTAPAGPTGGPAAVAPPVAPAPPPPAWPPLDPLGRALASGDVEGARAAAAALRRLLRTDPAARERAAALLLDPAAPPEIRRALALVFGTFGGAANDAVLLAVLRDFPQDAALVRCALLGLGGTREPEDDDDVFGLGDRPWGAKGPGGLGITVKREIGEAATREAAERFLRGADAGLREAAAAALRHSVDKTDVRESFLRRLAVEDADAVAAPLGEALAGRAARTPDPADRGEIVGALLARAGDERLDAYRFRMEDDFEGLALDPEDRAALSGLAASGRSFGVRSFALTALARSAARSGGPATAAVRSELVALLASDGSQAIRDLAARLLRRLPYETGTAEALARAARGDAAWNVRFTALETLASFGAKPVVKEALETANGDKDARVRDRAAELLRGLK
jgi:HEAT repeat protein